MADVWGRPERFAFFAELMARTDENLDDFEMAWNLEYELSSPGAEVYTLRGMLHSPRQELRPLGSKFLELGPSAGIPLAAVSLEVGCTTRGEDTKVDWMFEGNFVGVMPGVFARYGPVVQGDGDCEYHTTGEMLPACLQSVTRTMDIAAEKLTEPYKKATGKE